MAPDQKQHVVSALETHAKYREKVCGRPGDTDQTDLSWQVGMSPSMLSMIAVIENAVFHTEYDAALKTGVKNQKGPEDVLQYQAFASLLEEIYEARAKEKERDVNGTSTQASVVAVAGDDADDADRTEASAGAFAELRDEGCEGISPLRRRAERKVRAHVR